MQTARTSQLQPPAAGLPEVPDYPGSPLSAWKHYGILKFVEEKIYRELENISYDGRLIGLRISYNVGSTDESEPGDEYTMAYGYNVYDPVEPIVQETDPLSEEFVVGLYDFISDMIANNISPYVPEFTVRLDAAFNPSPSTYTIACRICQAGECNQGHQGTRRRMIRINQGPWRCLHNSC